MKTPTRSEASIQKAVVDWARKQECVCIKQSVGKFGSSGWPDYLIIAPSGDFCFMEFKRLGKKPTPLQDSRIAELRSRCVKVYVADSVQPAKWYLNAQFGLTKGPV